MDVLTNNLYLVLGTLLHPSSTTLVVLAIFTTLAIAVKVIYNIWFHPLAVFPGPKLYAVTDVTIDWQQNVQRTFLPSLQALHRQYGPIIRTGPNALSVDGSIAWPQVYSHRSDNSAFIKLPGFFGPQNDVSLIMAPRDSHRRQRRHVSHAFSEAALAEQQSYVLKYLDMIMDKFGEFAKQETEVNFVDWVNFMTFDIIGDLAFGESFGSLSQDDYHPWVRALVDSVHGFSLAHFIRCHPLFAPIFPLMLGTKFIKQVLFVHRFSVAKAQARIDRGEIPGRTRDFMSYISRPGKKNVSDSSDQGLTRQEQIVLAPLLVTAGSETTATALSGFMFLLGRHHEAMRHLQQEIRGACRDGREFDIKSSARLPYLQACIEETLRLYPPAVGLSPRVSPGAIVDGRWVPKGTRITTSPYVTQRNPDHFVDPDAFRPERWLQPSHPQYETRYARDNRAVFKPFSFGPRDCIGKSLAYAEMRIFVTRLVLRFDWELLPGQEDWMSKQKTSVTWEKGPLMVRFREPKA